VKWVIFRLGIHQPPGPDLRSVDKLHSNCAKCLDGGLKPTAARRSVRYEHAAICPYVGFNAGYSP